MHKSEDEQPWAGASSAGDSEDWIDVSDQLEPEDEPGKVKMSKEVQNPKQTIIEAGSEFTGSIQSPWAIVVNGTIDGHVQAPSLNVTTTGALLGSVKTKTLRSQGTLSANIDAEEVFVFGAIRSKTVIKTKRLEMRIASSDESQLEINFSSTVLDASESR